MFRYLYHCRFCGAAFLDPRGNLPLLCLCRHVYTVYRFDATVWFSEALDFVSRGLSPPIYPSVLGDTLYSVDSPTSE